MKTAQRIQFDSYFSDKDTSKRIPPELIQTKLLQLRAGDQNIRDEFISNYLGLVFAIVARVIRASRRDRFEETVSVGILTLIEALEGIRTGKRMQEHDNIDAYIHKTVYYELLEFLQTDYLIRPPIHSDWLREEIKEHGVDYLREFFYTVQYYEVSSYNDFNGDANNDFNGAIWGLSTPSPQKLRELQEILESEYFTTIEKKIIQMRIEGETLQEIGKALGMSHVAVLKRLRSQIIPQLHFLLGIA